MCSSDLSLLVRIKNLSLAHHLLNFSPLFFLVVSMQKILTMIPTEEEKQKIQEAQLLNPDVPLGSAEQFLLTLSSISELSARLQLWAFKMDYDTIEKVRHLWTLEPAWPHTVFFLNRHVKTGH